jgi:hypothetical protein
VPSVASRERIWDGVSATVGVAGAASVRPANVAAVSGANGTVAMAIFGGVIVVGLAAVLLSLPPRRAIVTPGVHPSKSSVAAASEQSIDEPVPSALSALAAASDVAPPHALTPKAATSGAVAGVAPSAPAAVVVAKNPGRSPAPARDSSNEDALMREANLVAEARGALMRGDAEGALVAIRAASRARLRALEPEELSLEAQALRTLGRTDEAVAQEIMLRKRFPDHALAR